MCNPRNVSMDFTKKLERFNKSLEADTKALPKISIH